MTRFTVLLCTLIFTLFGAEDKSYFLYCENETVEQRGMIDRSIYQDAVQNLPICCVDVFLFDPNKRSYLLVLRDNPPAKGKWWFPGGRLFKGESFFDCAVRKCKEEVKMDVLPIAQMGTAITIFPDSAWDCQTHTVNTVIVAVPKNTGRAPSTDNLHSDWAWKPFNEPPSDPYLQAAYIDALKVLSESFPDLQL